MLIQKLYAVITSPAVYRLLRILIIIRRNSKKMIHAESMGRGRSPFFVEVAGAINEKNLPRLFLLYVGGSDFHGGNRNDAENFGKYTIPFPFHLKQMKND